MTLTAVLQTARVGAAGAQGLNCYGLLAAPPASLGVNGETAIDAYNAVLYPAKTNGAWPNGINLVGGVGAQGTAGTAAANLSNSAVIWGPTQAYTATTTGVGSTYLTIPMPNASALVPFFHTGNSGSQLFAATLVIANSSASATCNFRLIDLDAGTVYYTSPSYTGGTVNYVTPGVSLPANIRVAWQVKSNNVSSCFSAAGCFTAPSTNGQGVCTVPPCAINTAVTLSTTAKNLLTYGSAVAAAYYDFAVNSWLYQATFSNFGSSSNTVFQLYNNSGGAAVYSSPAMAAGSEVTLQFAPGQYRLNPSTQYLWRVTGNGSANVYCNWMVGS